MAGVKTELDYECVIVGGGPAGLSAAVYMGRFRRRTLLLDSGTGRWSYGQQNENYLGFPRGVSARRLRDLGAAQAARFGVTPTTGRVLGIDQLPDAGFQLITDSGVVTTSTVIWAAGVRDRWPEFKGARKLVGKLMFWCIVCDGWRSQGRRLLLLGDTEAAAENALQFLTYTDQVTLLTDPDCDVLSAATRARLQAEGITLLHGRVKTVRLNKDDTPGFECVHLQDGRLLQPDLIFSLYGSDPNTELLRGLPITLTEKGVIDVNAKYQTSLPGFYAAGDVTNHHSDQVSAAVHGGAQAAQAANYALYPVRQRLPETIKT